MYVIHLNKQAIEALERGEFIVIDLGDFCCKMEKYTTEEAIMDEFYSDYPEVILKPDHRLLRRIYEKKGGNSLSEQNKAKDRERSTGEGKTGED